MLGIPFVLDIDELQSSAVLRGVCVYLSIGIWDVIRDYLGQGLAKDREHFGVAAVPPALKEEGFLNSRAPVISFFLVFRPFSSSFQLYLSMESILKLQ